MPCIRFNRLVGNEAGPLLGQLAFQEGRRKMINRAQYTRRSSVPAESLGHLHATHFEDVNGDDIAFEASLPRTRSVSLVG